ncbi:MAG TPA: hypothetical protein VKH41_05205 [Myxococcota bacterium]|nr:hypothetical protein [Myxococcota bacterium]
MALWVPEAPAALALEIAHRWDGEPLPGLGAFVRLSAVEDGLWVEAGTAHRRAPRIPDAPRGARVEGLWEFDVVECFVAAADGRYFELELGAGGHYLALAFDAPRRRATDFARDVLAVESQSHADGWRARCLVPRAWLPEPVARANAFAIADGEFAVHAPVGGERPDFHRPHAFPELRVPSWEGR